MEEEEMSDFAGRSIDSASGKMMELDTV